MGKGQLLFKGEKAKKPKKRSKAERYSSNTPKDGIIRQTNGTDDDDEGNNINDDEGGDSYEGLGVMREIHESRNSITENSTLPSTTSSNNERQQQSRAISSAAAGTKSSSSPPTAVRNGAGRITTSGTVVTGFDTKFEKELDVGDAILCQEELRIVTMRLSNISLNLSSPFSIDVKIPTTFQYVRKPCDSALERKLALQKSSEQKRAMEKNVFDLYNDQSVVYREKTETGSYRIKRETIGGGDKQVTRGDLLQLRSTRTSDKYC
jgi:hypothetical protein